MTRTRPYTEAGIARVPCAHCGGVSSAQWNLKPCVIGRRRWFALCTACDIELNGILLAFVNAPDGEAMMADYRERKAA